MSIALRLENLSKSFAVGKRLFGAPKGHVHAVHPVTLDVPEGETLGIVGESGCGKSTLARMLVGLLAPSGGHIEIEGQPLDNADPAQFGKRIQYVFQDPISSLNPRKTIRQIMEAPLKRLHGMARAARDKCISEIFAQVNLREEFLERYPHEFSGGQAQRIGIARALATGPKVLLSDEATSALDPETTQTVLSLLKDINRELGLTILLITHEMAVVRDIASHVAVIDGGRIVEHGETYDIFTAPRHATTRSFLSGVTGVTLPAFVKDRLVPNAPAQGGEEVIRVTFAGQHATDPMLARLTQDMGIPVNILAGAVEEIGTRPFGNLLVSLPVAKAAEARSFLESHGLMTEVLGYVG